MCWWKLAVLAHLDRDEVARRRDFRGLPIVTIDGETARDFDDAVLVEQRDDGGYELQVHIADWPNTCGEGTDLDLEARLQREPASTFPIAPFPCCRKSSRADICSLRPGGRPPGPELRGCNWISKGSIES